MQQSLERILGILCTVLDAYSAVIFFPGKEEGEHLLSASFSLGDKIDQNSTVYSGKGLVGWILRNQQPLLVPNFDQRKNQLGYYKDNEEQSIKAFMGCALPKGLGVLCLDSKRQYSFSEKDQKLLQLFAELTSCFAAEADKLEEQQAIIRYYTALQLVYTLRRRQNRWNDFLQQFLELLSATTGFSYISLCTLDTKNESYRVEGENRPLLRPNGVESQHPLTAGMVGWVFRNGAPLFSGGPEGAPPTPLFGRGVELPEFQTVMTVPLVFSRNVRGVLCLAHEGVMPLSEESKIFTRMASEHLSLFLENLHVKSRLQMLRHQISNTESSNTA